MYMFSFFVFYIIFIVTIVYFDCKVCAVDKFENFVEITEKNGYKSEKHVVITKDGYRLAIFRMVKENNCNETGLLIPVLLMHGLLQSSDCFIDAGPKSGLAYLLCDACYDVWVGNFRGNYYSRAHIQLNSNNDADFWKYTADEMGVYDLPAIIDFILNITKAAKLNVVGFSEGASNFYIMCSELPEYCKKIGVLISLGPPTSLVHSRSIPLAYLFRFAVFFEDMLFQLGKYELLYKGGNLQALAEYICSAKINVVTRIICNAFLSTFDAYNPGSISDEALSSIFKHFPAGASVRHLARYGQIRNVGRMQKYDYGEETNIEKYGTIKPPVYDLRRVTAAVVIIQGRNDHMVDVRDSKIASMRLPNAEFFEVEDPLWNHFDMVYSRFIKDRIFNQIHTSLLKYS